MPSQAFIKPDKNDPPRYCCGNQTFWVKDCPILIRNVNAGDVPILAYPDNNTNNEPVLTDLIALDNTTTVVFEPGRYTFDFDCEALKGTEVDPEAPIYITCEKAPQINSQFEALCAKLEALAGTNGEGSEALLAKLCEALISDEGTAVEKLCAILEAVGEDSALCGKLQEMLNSLGAGDISAILSSLVTCLEQVKANTAAITGIETSLGQVGCTRGGDGELNGSVLVCKVSDTTTEPPTDTIKVWWFGYNGEVIEDFVGEYEGCTNLQALADLLQSLCGKIESVIEECCYVVDGAITQTSRCQTFARPDPFGVAGTNYFVRINGQQIDLPTPHTHADILAALNGVCGDWQIVDGDNGRQVLCNTDLTCTSAVFGQCTKSGLNLSCSLSTSIGVIVDPKLTCRKFIRTWGKYEEPIADTLANIQSSNEAILACLEAQKGPKCTEQTFGPLSDCIFPDDEEADIVTVATDVYVDIIVCDGVAEEPFVYTLAGATKEPYDLQGELANPDKTLFAPELECPDVPYEAATIQKKLNILDNSLWTGAPVLNIGAGNFPATDIEVSWTDGTTSLFVWSGGAGLFAAFRDWLIEETGCLYTPVVANWVRFPTSLPWGLTDEDVPRECLFARGWSFECCINSKCIERATVVRSDDEAWVGVYKDACTYEGPLETIYVGHVGCNIIYKDCRGNLIELPEGCCPIPAGGSGSDLSEFKGTKTGGIEGADYSRALCYINGRPVANARWEWFDTSGSLISGANLGEFIANVEAAGYNEFSVGEQHYICPVPASYTEPGSHFFEADGNTVSKPEAVALETIEGAPTKAQIETQCYLRVLDCNSDKMLSKLDGLAQLQEDANEMASDALVKQCLLDDFWMNCADEPRLAETLVKPEDGANGELCLEGDVADQYTAGTTIALKDALGNICGEAIVANVETPATFEEAKEGPGKTTVAITDCTLAEGKTPVQVKTAKPVLQATVAAVKAVVAQVPILQAKATVNANLIKPVTTVRG